MLELTNLRASYGKTPILRDVDITVDEGEIVGIMGKNGVGKTTLIKAVMGLLEADEGTIVFDGEDVTDEPADVRARRGMGYIPQGRDVFPELTVEENLRMGETINEGNDCLQYEAVYDYFPILEERREQEAGTMSGGQQQMLAIGRALIGNPDLLLLDEPSEGVQPSIVQDITRDLRGVNEELGTTICFVEQNLHVVQNLAERCYAIDKGEIVDELGPDRLESRDAVTEYLAV
ncbi:ABC transporter related protein [Haloterrigena turkmenica DSM 5511]|uniref:ABC transporter related protein n=1 Tax=Haloterrigena turkmenica (strain ATCC 51198 / DSM 5511 / JCM 9101 / NCIMB 13204 / VKM B-1734 / 4k) TaxID=543526 RepID=D2RQW9_HALTV|nr:ABC transporter ATP-binding protein [Haloterrigena turkmenica]ADB60450.1 ABC transporter related protein [Haloterrigena turkmenica DSM 5511]